MSSACRARGIACASSGYVATSTSNGSAREKRAEPPPPGYIEPALDGCHRVTRFVPRTWAR